MAGVGVAVAALFMIAMAAFEMLIIIFIWQWIAKIRVPVKHALILGGVIGVLVVLVSIGTSAAGVGASGGTVGSIVFWPTIIYLIIWTVQYKKRAKTQPPTADKPEVPPAGKT